MRLRVFWTGVLLVTLAGTALGEPLRAFRHAEYVDHPANDGDSFMVTMGGDLHMIRLYYVDCPETTTGTDADRRRALDQARYFGLEDLRRILHFGQMARGRVGALLREQPFDLNHASPEELQELKGVGVALAERIIQHRPCTSVDDLLRVPGIGPATLKNARPFVTVDGE